MTSLWLYRGLSRFKFLSYRSKIMVVAFVGTHIPLIAVVFDVAWQYSADWHGFFGILATALVATLAGTGATLFVLIHLLRPVLLTSRALSTYGETRFITPMPTQFSDEVGTLMANTVATLTDLEAARHRLEHFDTETGLANRQRFELAIAAAIQTGAPFAVCVVASNSYGRIGATIERRTADLAMKQIGDRLVSHLGGASDLARIAPNQFAFIAYPATTDAASDADALQDLENLIERCGGRLSVGDIALRPSLTGGMARFPADSTTHEQLLDFAAAAAAFVGKGTLASAYVPQTRSDAFDRYQIEEDLKYALERDEFHLNFQPVVSASQERAVGAEALIRWIHPTKGLVRPDQFIPVAESSGLINDIGLWVMDAACRQVTEWNASGRSDLSVAVNLSARQFHDPELVNHVRRAIDEHHIQGDQLEIELTESSLMDDFDQSRATFGKLRDLGVGIAIDDFGTGFASLSYLRQLPFSKLKLDREFVSNVDTNPESQAICGALITLAQGLGLKVLAEGTERDAEIRYLRELGCDLFQGFYLSRPVQSQDFFAAITPGRLTGLLGRTTGDARMSA